MRNIRAFMGIAANDLRQEVRSGAIIGNIIVGIVFALLLGFIMGLIGTPKDLSIAVYDSDEMIQLSSNDELAVRNVSSESKALDLVKQNEYNAALIIKDGKAKVTIDDSYGIVVIDSIKAHVSTQITETMLSIEDAASGLFETEYLYGSDVESDWFSLKMVAGQLIPLVIFMFAVVILGESIVAERETKTIFELAMAPVRSVWVVLGKILGGAVTMMIALVIIQLLIRYGFGVEANGSLWAGLLASILMGFGFLGFAYILSALLPTIELYDSVIGIVVVMPMLLISGVFLPLESFPEIIQTISGWSPLTWAVEVVKDTTFREASFSDVKFNIYRLTMFFVGAVIIGSLLVGRMLKKSLEG